MWRIRQKCHLARAILQRPGARRIGLLGALRLLMSRTGLRLARKGLKLLCKMLYLWLEDSPVWIVEGDRSLALPASGAYRIWLAQNFPRPADLRGYQENLAIWPYRPTVSIVMTVNNPCREFLQQALQSVASQIYPYWQLCLADRSGDESVHAIIRRFAAEDTRVQLLPCLPNDTLAVCNNGAVEMASGDYTLFLEPEDQLTRDCLYHIVAAVNRDRTPDLLYSDEDTIDARDHLSSPHFKPGWCPDNLLSRNYLGHVVAIRTSIFRQVGGLRPEFGNCCLYDLLLRLTETTKRIHHIPHVLYHGRAQAKAVAGGGEKALREALQRRGEEGQVLATAGSVYAIRYQVKEHLLVSIFIPTKDHAAVLQACLASVFAKTNYAPFEVVVTSNDSHEPALFALLEKYGREYPGKFFWHQDNRRFNFSQLTNSAVAQARGDYIVLLNNDTQVISADWLQAMVEQAQRPSIGAVGAKLLYADNTIQHAGVVVGIHTGPTHAFRHMPRNTAGYFHQIDGSSNYAAVTAACMMCRKHLFGEVGGFDEQLALEYSDTDFCLKLLERGYRNIYLPHVELYHFESVTRGSVYADSEAYQHHLRELGIFHRRWHAYVAADPCYARNLSRKEPFVVGE